MFTLSHQSINVTYFRIKLFRFQVLLQFPEMLESTICTIPTFFALDADPKIFSSDNKSRID